MFENILYQDQVITEIRQQIETGTLPRAVLFYGPAFSGKGAAALELARVMTCEKKALWDCSCASCKKHRLLNHHSVLMAGDREFEEDLLAGYETLLRNQNTGSAYLFYRNVKKILARYHPEIWYQEEGRIKNLPALTANCEELLEEFEPDRIGSIKDIKKSGEKLIEACMKLIQAYPSDNIPIYIIRNINQWIHRSNEGLMKIVLLENADRMLEGSRNALLKSLEEPPVNTCFILTAARRESLIPTIRSRLRPYRFFQRTTEQDKEVLSRIFKEEAHFSSLDDFFQSHHPVNGHSVAQIMDRFWHLLKTDENEMQSFLDELKQFCSKISQKKHLKIVLSALEKKVLDEVKSKASNDADLIEFNSRAMKIEGLMRQAIIGYEVYNQNALSIMESLFFEMKALV